MQRFKIGVLFLVLCIVAVLVSRGVILSHCAMAADNLIPNPSLEAGSSEPLSWTSNTWGNNDATFSYPVAGFESAAAAEVRISQYSNGDAKWYFNDVPVEENQSYYFSEYFRSTAYTEVIVKFVDTKDEAHYQSLDTLLAQPEWHAYATTFLTPPNTKAVSIYHVLRAPGSLRLDRYSLTPSNNGPEAASFDQGYVTLSFDDGWLTHYTEAKPILDAAGIHGSFYLISNKLTNPNEAYTVPVADFEDAGEEHHTREQRPSVLVRAGEKIATYLFGCQYNHTQRAYISTEQMHALTASGHEVSAHTLTHADLAKLSADAADLEIRKSRTDLQQLGAGSVDTFVYPYGSYNASVMQSVQNSGYIGARSVAPGSNYTTSNKFALKVRNITPNTTIEEVRTWIAQAKQTHTWLILVFHQIDNHDTEYSTTPEFLKLTTDEVKASNITPITIREGLQLMK